MNALFRSAAKACLMTAASGALCIPVAGLFAQDTGAPSSGAAGTKIRQVQAVSPDASAQSAQAAPQQETEVEKQLKKLYGKKGQEAPSMRLEDAPNTQPPAKMPSGGQAATPAGPQTGGLQNNGTDNSAAATAPQGKPNWFERTFHIGKGRKKPAPANQYAAPTPPPTAPYRYPSQTPAARPAPPAAYRPPVATAPPHLPAARPAPLVAGPAATAAPAQPQFREPAPLGPTAAPRALAGRDAAANINKGRVAPPVVRPRNSQPLLDESNMNEDSESLELDDDDDDPKTAGQPPKVLSSDAADGPAASPYTGLKIAPNEAEQQFVGSRPRADVAEEKSVDAPRPTPAAAAAGEKASPPAAVAAKSYKPASDDFDLKDDDDEDDEDDDKPAVAAKEPAKHAEDASPSDNKPVDKPAAPAPFSGLKGFCPVVLKDNRKLVNALPDIKSEYNGKTYAFSSLEAKQAFDENPRKYAPVCGGTDVVKQTAGEAGMTGTLEHAAWYRGRLYLFSTSDSRHEFVETPSKFVVDD